MAAPLSRRSGRVRAAATVVATVVLVNAFLFVAFPPYVAQLQPGPPANPPPALPAPDLDVVRWRDERFTPALQVGGFRASQIGDVDGDGSAELVAVGFYGIQLGCLVVYNISNERPVEIANVSWVQSPLSGVKAILLRQLDGRPGAEIVVGGALLLEEDRSYTAIQIFTWRDGALLRQGGVMKVGGHGETVVQAVLPPFVGQGVDESFLSLSSEFFNDEPGVRAVLTSWHRNESGGFERGNVTAVHHETTDAAALVCPACNGRAAAIGLIGSNAAAVMIPDVAQGAVALFNQSATGFFWQTCAWLGNGSEWEFVALGQGYATRPAGLATFVFNVTLTGARIGGYVPSSFDVPFRFSSSFAIPDQISRPWAASNGSGRDLHVVLMTTTSEGITSTGYRAHYARGATLMSSVLPVWATSNATVYEVLDLRTGAAGQSRMAYLGASGEEPAIMIPA